MDGLGGQRRRDGDAEAMIFEQGKLNYEAWREEQGIKVVLMRCAMKELRRSGYGGRSSV